MSLKTILKMESTKKPIIVIIGTTGVGKSKLSIDLATKYNGEIINADSMQMYEKCPIITNKHPLSERNGIPHHVMGHIHWNEEYFIHRFHDEVLREIESVYQKGKVPVIVGGTNYYLQSLLFKNKVIDTQGQSSNLNNNNDKKVREYMNKEYATKSRLTEEQIQILSDDEHLYENLQKIDDKIANKYHPRDTRRIKRLLEIYFTTNEKPSKIFEEQLEQDKAAQLRYDTLIYWIWSEQEVLNKRLDDRVESMFQEGALQEIHELYEYFQDNNIQDCTHGIWQVIGFKEFLPWFEAKEEDKSKVFEECKEKMKRKTRKYSKTQIKWIKNVLIKDLEKTDKSKQVYLKLINATDLSTWNTNILGDTYSTYDYYVKMIDEDDKNEEKLVQIDIAENAKEMLYTDDPALAKKKNISLSGQDLKLLGKNDGENSIRKKFTCNVCIDRETNSNLVLIGEDQFKFHLTGRRHRSNINRQKRKRDYEEWVKLQKNKANNE